MNEDKIRREIKMCRKCNTFRTRLHGYSCYPRSFYETLTTARPSEVLYGLFGYHQSGTAYGTDGREWVGSKKRANIMKSIKERLLGEKIVLSKRRDNGTWYTSSRRNYMTWEEEVYQWIQRNNGREWRKGYSIPDKALRQIVEGNHITSCDCDYCRRAASKWERSNQGDREIIARIVDGSEFLEFTSCADDIFIE